MVTALLADTLRQPKTIGLMPAALVTNPVPVGPELFHLFRFSVPVSTLEEFWDLLLSLYQ